MDSWHIYGQLTKQINKLIYVNFSFCQNFWERLICWNLLCLMFLSVLLCLGCSTSHTCWKYVFVHGQHNFRWTIHIRLYDWNKEKPSPLKKLNNWMYLDTLLYNVHLVVKPRTIHNEGFVCICHKLQQA